MLGFCCPVTRNATSKIIIVNNLFFIRCSLIQLPAYIRAWYDIVLIEALSNIDFIQIKDRYCRIKKIPDHISTAGILSQKMCFYKKLY